MFKKAMFCLASFMLVSTFAYAEEKFTVSGEVGFQYDGDVYICLLTMEEFRDVNIPGHELSKSPCKVIQMNTDLKKAGRIPFSFDNIPKGTYCIFTYQDVNMNGKTDFENYALSEPWGSYKENISSMPGWGVLKFDLGKNLSGIKIEM